jgi:hypothetical protein
MLGFDSRENVKEFQLDRGTTPKSEYSGQSKKIESCYHSVYNHFQKKSNDGIYAIAKIRTGFFRRGGILPSKALFQ